MVYPRGAGLVARGRGLEKGAWPRGGGRGFTDHQVGKASCNMLNYINHFNVLLTYLVCN